MADFIKALDVSSYQGRELGDLMVAHEAEAAMVRLYLPWEKPDLAHSLGQINSLRLGGYRIGVYVWPYVDVDPIRTVDEAANIIWATFQGAERPPVLWFDVEPFNGSLPTRANLISLIDRCVVDTGMLGGIYTRRNIWQEYYGDTGALSDCPLWIADYRDGVTPDNVELFGLWRQRNVWGVQYRGAPVDQNLFRPITFR